MHLSKKWTIGGIVIALSAFFMSPDSCVSSRQILHWISPDSAADGIGHFGLLIGSLLAILGKGLLEKEDGRTPKSLP